MVQSRQHMPCRVAKIGVIIGFETGIQPFKIVRNSLVVIQAISECKRTAKEDTEFVLFKYRFLGRNDTSGKTAGMNPHFLWNL